MSDSSEAKSEQILIFTLDESVFALPLRRVIKVIHAIEIRYLPKAPEIISGIINVRGQIIPVVDIRKRLELKVHEIIPDDRFIIADTGKRVVAILVNSVTGIRNLASQQLSVVDGNLSFAEHVSCIAKIDDELVLIYDLDRFLSLDEETELEQSLQMEKNG